MADLLPDVDQEHAVHEISARRQIKTGSQSPIVLVLQTWDQRILIKPLQVIAAGFFQQKTVN